MAEQKIKPCLWFNDNAEEAVRFYTSVFKDSKILSLNNLGGGTVVGSFELFGQEIMILQAGDEFRLNEAISFYVDCETQEEVDYYWTKLTENGGEESQCGWLKDKFGLSWQIIPKALGRLMGDPDREKAGRVMQAMLKMKKIDIATLQQAYDQE